RRGLSEGAAGVGGMASLGQLLSLFDQRPEIRSRRGEGVPGSPGARAEKADAASDQGLSESQEGPAAGTHGGSRVRAGAVDAANLAEILGQAGDQGYVEQVVGPDLGRAEICRGTAAGAYRDQNVAFWWRPTSDRGLYFGAERREPARG